MNSCKIVEKGEICMIKWIALILSLVLEISVIAMYCIGKDPTYLVVWLLYEIMLTLKFKE